MKQKNIKGENAKCLIQKVSNRWNSWVLMIKRVLEQLSPLNLILKKDKNHENLVLKEQDEKILTEAQEVLDPFVDITNKLSGEKYGTLSMVIPSLLYLENSLKPNLNDSVFKSLLKRNLTFILKNTNFIKIKHI